MSNNLTSIEYYDDDDSIVISKNIYSKFYDNNNSQDEFDDDYDDASSSSNSFESSNYHPCYLKKPVSTNYSIKKQSLNLRKKNNKSTNSSSDIDHKRDYYYEDDLTNDKENQEINDHDNEHNQENKRYSYCYLCSINAHVHKKTEPVPLNKRRYLRPYTNPMQLIKKYEIEEQNNLDIRTRYTFFIKTGSATNAGTNSNVWFEIIGTAGKWHNTELKSPKLSKEMKFPAGSLVELDLEGPIIGDLKKLKIRHDGKSIKDGWYLEYVEIVSYKLEQTYRFICDQWLSIHRPPNNSTSIILTLHNNIFNNEKFKNSTEYIVLVKTDRPLVGSNEINVQFQFVGTKGQSQVFSLLTPYLNLFDRNQLDAFLIMSSIDLGKPDKLKLAHNGRHSQKEKDQWSIESIKVIYSRDPNKFYGFKVDKWLEKNQKQNALISADVVSSIESPNDVTNVSGKMIYHITVITGNVKFAGTDARVFIELKGTKGISTIHRLHNQKSKKEFERNQMNHFHIFDNNIGQIKSIRIWHDNTGSAPGWFLDAILIRSIATTITGKQEKHDSDLSKQLDLLRMKFKIKDLNPEELEQLFAGTDNKISSWIKKRNRRNSSTIKNRSKSADLNSQNQNKTTGIRSSSADNKNNENQLTNKSQEELNKNNAINFNDLLKKNTKSSAKATIKSMELNRRSPSILKSPSSTRKDMMRRKRVQFNSENMYEKGDKALSGGVNSANSASKSSSPYINLNWILSISYDEQAKNSIKGVRTIENFDKTIKNLSNEMILKYEAASNIKTPKDGQNSSEIAQAELTDNEMSKVINEMEKCIYVFECKRWLAKDMEDKKIERVLKLTNILKTK